jgi:hypothetical protein
MKEFCPNNPFHLPATSLERLALHENNMGATPELSQ